jgi:hypothetical protein
MFCRVETGNTADGVIDGAVEGIRFAGSQLVERACVRLDRFPKGFPSGPDRVRNLFLVWSVALGTCNTRAY